MLSKNLNNALRKDYAVNVIRELQTAALPTVSKPNGSAFLTQSGARQACTKLLHYVNTIEGYKVDVVVTCWEPSLGHLLTSVRNYDRPLLHVRWIFVAAENVTPDEASMSKTLHNVGCRGIFVSASSSYVPLDTYANCSAGLRRFTGPHDRAFEDRNLRDLASLRYLNESSVPTVKDYRNVRLEPQATIVESIVRKSGAILTTAGQYEKFGRRRENFLFTGAVGAVQMKQKDLGSFEIYLTESIWHGLSIAGVVRYDSLTFLSPLPTEITDLTIIGRPFTRALWVAVWASLCVYLFLLVVITTSRSTVSASMSLDVLEEAVELLFYLSSALVNHAPDVRLSRRSSARILVAFWFMFAIIISAGFVGMLTSYTNFPPKTRPITTLEQLSDALERKSVNLCIKNNRYYRDILTFHLRSGSSVLKEHLEQKLRMGDCMTTLCCLDKVSRGTHVFVTNREEARFYTGKDFKGAVTAEQDFFLVHVVVIAPKWSPYAAAFAVVSQRFMETGVSMCALKLVRRRRTIRRKFQDVSTRLGAKCSCRALKLNDFYGLLVVWAFGLTLALLVLGCEVAWNARHNTTRPSKKARPAKRTRRDREKTVTRGSP
ncbi:hypothetical protein HPB51_006415 [Rhipicephalus microplus]|uniref:Ionotropic glutamate receptor C-terminal domain-containing protein n=1 Tax=Rhipicephalus microplus TaxID=6941 RepID=A0A9J6EYB2_RHIMP|nr:hypothetical protein HPB51_006415 [Rhipicephalus microplus]